MDAPHDKQSILDIKAKTAEGKQINICRSNMYFHRIKEGGNYSELKKCVTINILNYSCLPNDRYHNVFHLREDHP